MQGNSCHINPLIVNPQIAVSPERNAAVARALAGRGVPVFPCRWRDEGKGRKAKSPLTNNGFKAARPSAAPWDFTPAALVGMPIPSGVVVVDTDGDVGDATLAELGLLDAANLSVLIVSTPSGGRHRWFAVEDPAKFSNTSHVNGLAAVDLRTAGCGYVIAPGCAYEAGAYRIVKGDISALDRLSLMPWPLAKALRRPEPSLSEQAAPAPVKVVQRRVRNGTPLEKRLTGLFNRLVDNVRRAPAGGRHAALLKNGRTLAGYLHYAEGFTRGELEKALFAACVENGRVSADGEGVVLKTIENAIDHGVDRKLFLGDRPAPMGVRHRQFRKNGIAS